MAAPRTPAAPEADFPPATKARRPLPKAPRADNAPIEGREIRSSEEGFGASARQLMAVEDSRVGKAPTAPTPRTPTPADEDPPITKLMDAADTAENDLDGDDDPDPPTKVRGKKPDPKKK